MFYTGSVQLSIFGQQRDAEGFETFQYRDGATIYTMKNYYFCLLKSGEKRDFTAQERTEMQQKHLAHISSLAEAGKVQVSGTVWR